MMWYFKHITKYQNSQQCYAKIQVAIDAIINASNYFNDFLITGDSKVFLYSCEFDFCKNQAMILYNMVANNDVDCPMTQRLDQGYVFGGYFQGWKD